MSFEEKNCLKESTHWFSILSGNLMAGFLCVCVDFCGCVSPASHTGGVHLGMIIMVYRDRSERPSE